MWSFIGKHRTRFMAGTAVAVVAAGIFYLMSDSPVEKEENEKIEREREREREREMIHSGSGSVPFRLNRQSKSRLLMRIRWQFDMQCVQFIPTLKAKVVEIIDIEGTVRQIQELRSKSGLGHSKWEGLKVSLWDEIKVSSFTLLTVSSYMLSAVTTLLKLQLHVLGRSMYTVAAFSPFDEPDEFPLDSDMFRDLINGTYKQLFGEGLSSFCAFVKNIVTKEMESWKVQEKVQVEYSDLMCLLSSVRSSIELDDQALIGMIFLPSEARRSDMESTNTNTNTMRSDMESLDSKRGGRYSVQTLLAETWDLIECPTFTAAYLESVDLCFRLVSVELQRDVFANPDPNLGNGLGTPPLTRSPPLGAILPQVKAISNYLLPSNPGVIGGGSSGGSPNVSPNHMGGGGKSAWTESKDLGVQGSGSPVSGYISTVLKELSSGPILDSFCISVLDSCLEEVGGYADLPPYALSP